MVYEEPARGVALLPGLMAQLAPGYVDAVVLAPGGVGSEELEKVCGGGERGRGRGMNEKACVCFGGVITPCSAWVHPGGGKAQPNSTLISLTQGLAICTVSSLPSGSTRAVQPSPHNFSLAPTP